MDVISNTNLNDNKHQYPMSESGPVRTNIYIIFAEFSSDETSSIISYLHGHQFAPRGKNINCFEEIKQAIAERSWDIILCKSQEHAFDPLSLPKQLDELGKDIPVLQLQDQPNQDSSTEALLNGIQAVLPLHHNELLLLYITREYNHLISRRQLRLIELQLSESQKRCKLLMDNSALAVCFITHQKIVYLNNAFCKLFGYKIPDQLINKPILNLIASQEQLGMSELLSSFIDSGQNHLSYQLMAKRADNSNFTAHINLQQTLFNSKTCIQLTVEGNKHFKTEQKFAELDAITGLYNQEYFTNLLENHLRQALQGGNDTQLIYINISNLIQARSQLGSEASTMIARDVADILNQAFNKTHIKAKLSDNIFAVIYADPDTLKVKQIADSLHSRISSHQIYFNDQQIQLQSAIALVPITDTISNIQQVYERAEETLVQGKKLANQEEHVTIYSPLLDPNDDQSLQTIAQAQDAIANNKLRLLFQPIIPLVFHSEEQHYEVLLRMLDKNNQNILPVKFLSSVKHANLSEGMDKWVIEHSINQFHSSNAIAPKLKLFISVTDTVWERESLLMWFSDILRTSRVQADRIVVQISEIESVNSLSKAKYFVDGLRQLNCLICLKHYGSTSESKVILKTLDPDFVKFDGSFIQQLTQDAVIDTLFEDLLINLNSLGKITIATQVESPKVMSLLWKYGIGMVQGYYLQAPDETMKYEF